MSEELLSTLKILLSISGSVILLMIGILGFFIRRIIVSLDNFNLTLQTFSIDYSATKENLTNMKTNCIDKHRILDNRVTSHGRRLDSHAKDIEVLKVKIVKT